MAIEWDQGWCGLRAILANEPDLGVFLMKITDAPLHYHKKSVEYYLVLSGEGTMRLGDEEFEVKEGSFVHIPTGVKHSLQSDEEMEVLVVSKPLVTLDDHYT